MPVAPSFRQPSMRVRLRVEIRGAVQGVGFRPFVYRLADESRLDGWVVNDVGGVGLALNCFRDGPVPVPAGDLRWKRRESWL